MTRFIKDLTKEKLIELALTEPGTISGCYSMFHNFSGTNAWLLSIQQIDMGLDITPVMCGSKWVKAGIISEETKKRLYREKYNMFARLYHEFEVDKLDKNGNKIYDSYGKVVKETKVSFPLSRHFFSYSMFKKDEILKEHVENIEFDVNETLTRLGFELIKYESVNGNCQGYCYPNQKQIAINPLAENPTKTLLHEIAHCILHSDESEMIDSNILDKGIKEAEAELTAYICSVMLGETDDVKLSYSRGYVQHWLKDKDKFKKVNITRVSNAVDIIMKAVANYKGNYNLEKSKDIKRLNNNNDGE